MTLRMRGTGEKSAVIRRGLWPIESSGLLVAWIDTNLEVPIVIDPSGAGRLTEAHGGCIGESCDGDRRPMSCSQTIVRNNIVRSDSDDLSTVHNQSIATDDECAVEWRNFGCIRSIDALPLMDFLEKTLCDVARSTRADSSSSVDQREVLKKLIRAIRTVTVQCQVE